MAAQVPIIDISRTDTAELAAVDRACADHGFFLLAGHGLDDLIARMWQVTEEFFACGADVKDPLRRTETEPLGYWDRELTKRKRDHKEVFDYIDPDVGDPRGTNRWPADNSGAPREFQSTLTEFFDGFAGLANRALDVVTAAGAPAGLRVDRTTSTVRLNHYPVGDPVAADQREGLAPLGETALGYHTDPGVITLLLQDDTGGLQAESATHGWIDVPPEPGTVVVNLGDMSQVWSNDRHRAAVHRVVPMTERSRYSIPFFGNPARATMVAPADTDQPHYRPIEWREYISGRMTDNFADYGVDDIQISNYLID